MVKSYEQYRLECNNILREYARERKVRCNWCMWEGSELELNIIPDPTWYEVDACPACGRSDCLMDIGEVEDKNYD